MANSWFPLLISIGAAVVMASASLAAFSQQPTHPLVRSRSVVGAVFFAASGVCYAVSALLIITSHADAKAIVAALVGLVVFACAYCATRPESRS